MFILYHIAKLNKFFIIFFSTTDNSKEEPASSGTAVSGDRDVCVSNWVELAPRGVFLRARGNDMKED